MNDEQRQTLLHVARQTVEAAVTRQPVPEFQIDDPELCRSGGCFVTLKLKGRLRGCLGRFVSEAPLWQSVRDMAHAAATSDPRFLMMRLIPLELPDCHIEVSVLGPLEPIENPLDLELGTHGIYLKNGHRTGCFLPQVATDAGWSKEEFLNRCAETKAGLAPDAWKDPATEILVFTAEVIEE